MRPAFKKAIDFTKTRLFLNILFWAIYAIPEYVDIIRGVDIHYGRAWELLFKTIGLILMITFTYANNLFLIPTYLEKKKRFKYFLSVIGLILLFSFVFACKQVIIQEFFPQMNDMNIKDTSVAKHWPFNISHTAAVFCLTFLVYIMLLSFWLAGFTAAWYVRNYTLQQRKLEEIKKKQIETELDFLKSQLNPHFLFNTLNNLYSLSLKKSDEAPDTILKLSAILRYLLYESNTPLVSSDKEKEMMQAYIDLELLRIAEKKNLSFSIYTDDNYNIPPLLWLPILENVFKHGTRIITDDLYVDYRFSITNNKLTIHSKNHVKKISDNLPDATGGIGLDNLKKRLEILYPGKYKFNSYVRLDSAEKNNDYITKLEIDLA
jgi:two-component system LytT family sensor kinase